MALVRSYAMSLFFFALFASSAFANGLFRKPAEVKVKRVQFVEEVYVSLFTHITAEDVARAQDRLEYRFNSMPKNAKGGIQGAPLHYLAHTYFLKQQGWRIRGLDPHRLSMFNASAKVFDRDDFASYLEDFIASVTKGDGFDLEFSGAFVAVLEDFVMSEGIERLEVAYELNGRSGDSMVSREELQAVLDSFLVLRFNHASNPMEHKQDLQALYDSSDAVHGASRLLANDVLQTAALENQHRANPFADELWSFKQASVVVEQLSHQHGEVWEQECQELKGALVDMDPAGTGRVPLGQFYAQKVVGRWTLSESVEYLRQLGVLDESVPGRSPRVIIPNYVTAVSNCEPVSMYYSLCCIHECEDILGHFEMHIQRPAAFPSEILALVSNATKNAPRNLSSELIGALEQVASVSAGEVTLHGRLFAQWLHYVFPQDCPYPHMSETFKPLTPSEWFDEHGKHSDASQSVVDKYVQDEMDAALRKDVGQDHDCGTMSLWTLEDEMGWTVHSRREPSSRSAFTSVAKFFGQIVVMCSVFALVVVGELRRAYRAFFSTGIAQKEAGHVV